MASESSATADQQDRKNERSRIEFPYLDLDDAIGIAKAVHTIGGTRCEKEQLAARVGQSPTSGSFNLRLGTAKMYGLITYERGTITLTPLGIRACDLQQEKAARVQAFLTIPLYRRLYENFKGMSLPPIPGLENEMVTLGVAPKQKDRARQVFQRSAKEAGFFEFGNDRLVLPAMGTAMTGVEQRPPASPPALPQDQHEYPHFIQGLLEKLPQEGSVWPVAERKKWLTLAELAFDVMYADEKGQVG